MKTFIAKTLTWALIIGVCFFSILSIIDYRFTPGHKKNYFQEKARKEIDLLIVGSSRAEHVINPHFFSSNFTVYNYGIDGHGLPSNYLLLKVLLSKHKFKVSHILLNVDEISFNGTFGFARKFCDNFFVEDLHDDEVYAAYQNYRGKAFAFTLKHVPQTSTVIYNDVRKIVKNAPFITRSILDKSKKKYERILNGFDSLKGYSPLSARPAIANNNVKENYVIEKDDLMYFTKIVELCKKYNIQLSLFRAPILYCQNYISNDFDQYIQNFSKQNNIAFYDYKCQYQLNTHYYDVTHPADSIAQWISTDLSNKLQPVLAQNKQRSESTKPSITKVK
jgi:hypothetical protein